MRTVYPSIGIRIPEILLPRPDIDLRRWAVVACDQFTSQPVYWQTVAEWVGPAPSAYHLILPELYLGHADEAERIERIHQNMQAYLRAQLLTAHPGLVYVERTLGARTRRGLVLALDLEHYDYHPGAQSLIHSTEATIIERLPPRIRIRENARLELPHIMVLIDDPAGTVIEPLAAHTARLARLYDFDLMLDSGHLTGYSVTDPTLEAGVVRALEQLAEPAQMQAKYNLAAGAGPLLFAVGDGNHSLAAAKVTWEKIKASAGPDHPARYALVEVVNVHDAGLEFEPIHRVLFDVQPDLLAALQSFFTGAVAYRACPGPAEMMAAVDQAAGPAHQLGLLRAGECGVLEIQRPPANLPVGTLQNFVADYLQRGGARRVDYVHGADVVQQLGAQPGNVGFYVPVLHKSDLFKTVMVDGVLPLKSFSMGHAHEKRFYMEARQIML